MADELVDENGYPTEVALDRILRFEGTAMEFMNLIDRIWWPQGAQRMTRQWVEEQPHHPDKSAHEWRLATGGWSGNEDIIARMDETFFWRKFWYSTVVGGAYTFYIPEPDAHQVQFWGDWRNYPEPPSP
jgi:hypothetical protein